MKKPTHEEMKTLISEHVNAVKNTQEIVSTRCLLYARLDGIVMTDAFKHYEAEYYRDMIDAALELKAEKLTEKLRNVKRVDSLSLQEEDQSWQQT